MFFIKYYVSSQFTHYLTQFLCTTIHKPNCTVTTAQPLPQFHTKLPTFPHRSVCLFPCTENKSTPNVIKRIIFVTLGTFSCPSSRYLSIPCKSKNLYFGQLSLNLIHCVAPQTDIEPRYPGPDSTLQPFCLSSEAGTRLLYATTDRGTQLVNLTSVHT